MQVIKDIGKVGYDKKSAVTVGTFDGVHLGHSEIIKKLNSERSFMFAVGYPSFFPNFFPAITFPSML